MQDTNTETMGDRLRSRRALRNMSQGQLADALGVTQGAVSAWESGQPPQFEMVKKLAAFFDVSLDWLAGPLPDYPAGPDQEGC